jgi:hypothetical protein
VDLPGDVVVHQDAKAVAHVVADDLGHHAHGLGVGQEERLVVDGEL